MGEVALSIMAALSEMRRDLAWQGRGGQGREGGVEKSMQTHGDNSRKYLEPFNHGTSK